ncbi:MAG: hypothetical protein ACRDRO_15490 [Pseudonocardiaceae bacterium]
MAGKRSVVLISGAPGAGKSTLATPLTAALDLPLLAKDRIKETSELVRNALRKV